jgi:multidrug efflux pump subunit AcrA (membrane-fusion protein)
MFSNSNTRGARHPRWARIAAGATVAAAVATALAGCTSSSSTTAIPPTATLVPTQGSSVPSVELTQLGETRIGLETQAVTVGANGEANFPFAALLYEPNGQAAVYVKSGQFTFTRHFVTVDLISGGVVIVKSGVTPGDRVVTTGSEELLGVQNGVGEET